MPRILQLKTIDGALWARLDMDHLTTDGAMHIFTDKELRELRNKERQAVRAEIEAALDRWSE